MKVFGTLGAIWGEAAVCTFANAVKRLDSPTWGAARPIERADRLFEWMIETQQLLFDTQRPISERFRIAWAISPATCVGQDVDVETVSVVTAELAADADRLRHMTESLRAGHTSTKMRQEMKALIERYLHPPPPPDGWAFIVEAVRVAAESLPNIFELFGTDAPRASAGSGALRPNDLATTAARGARADVTTDRAAVVVPFALVVLDAMCPGYARELDPDVLRAAVGAWGRRARRGEANAWMLIEQLLRAPLPRLRADAMSRRWPEVQKRVRLNQKKLVLTLSKLLQERGIAVPSFTPREMSSPAWVATVVTAVRSAMPRRHPDGVRDSTHVGASPSLPDEFVERASSLLPPEEPGGRGRPPLDAAVVLASILVHINTRRAWRTIPYGEAARRRYASLVHTKRLDAFVALADEFGLRLDARSPPRR